MNFSDEKAIFVQIADRLADEILMGKYGEGERVPSVRDYSVLLEVNANTTVKSYDLLTSAGIIFKKRGMGFYVAEGAKELIRESRRSEFIGRRLPEMFRQMRMLGIGIDEVADEWRRSGGEAVAGQTTAGMKRKDQM